MLPTKISNTCKEAIINQKIEATNKTFAELIKNIFIDT